MTEMISHQTQSFTLSHCVRVTKQIRQGEEGYEKMCENEMCHAEENLCVILILSRKAKE